MLSPEGWFTPAGRMAFNLGGGKPAFRTERYSSLYLPYLQTCEPSFNSHPLETY